MQDAEAGAEGMVESPPLSPLSRRSEHKDGDLPDVKLPPPSSHKRARRQSARPWAEKTRGLRYCGMCRQLLYPHITANTPYFIVP